MLLRAFLTVQMFSRQVRPPCSLQAPRLGRDICRLDEHTNHKYDQCTLEMVHVPREYCKLSACHARRSRSGRLVQ